MADVPPRSRDQLLIDRFSHVLEQISERRRAALGVPGSVEGVTWNVFRSLGQIDPALWLPRLASRALGRGLKFTRRELDSLRISMWEPVAPPPSRQEDLRRRALRGTLVPAPGRLRRGRVTPLSEQRRRLAGQARHGRPLEPPLEVGAMLRTRRRVFYILPILEVELEMEIECDRRRDAVVRAIDAGLYETESARRVPPLRFYLILLYRDECATPRSVELLRQYRSRPAALGRALAHRRSLDAEAAARSLGMLRWREVSRRLRRALESGSLDVLQSTLVTRLLDFLRAMGLASASL